MHKRFKEYFELRGATVSGERAYGVINGYEVNFSGAVPYADNRGGVTLHISFYSFDENRRAIENEIKIFSTKFVSYSFDNYGVQFRITDWTSGKIADKVDEIINKVTEVLKNNNALGSGYCPVCGVPVNEQNSAKRNIEGKQITIDNDCANKINEAITQENLEFENAPNNYFKGFLGALIGAVAGAVIAIILYLVGFYAGISSFVAFFVGVLLYKKFGGKPNKMMLVIVTVTTFVMIMASIMLLYLLAAVGFTEGKYGMFEAFTICMSDVEGFESSFIADMAMTLLFTVVGCVSEIVKTARNIKRSKNI